MMCTRVDFFFNKNYPDTEEGLRYRVFYPVTKISFVVLVGKPVLMACFLIVNIKIQIILSV